MIQVFGNPCYYLQSGQQFWEHILQGEIERRESRDEIQKFGKVFLYNMVGMLARQNYQHVQCVVCQYHVELKGFAYNRLANFRSIFIKNVYLTLSVGSQT